ARLSIPDDALGRNQLYQHIYQARQQLARAGVSGSMNLIERRNAVTTDDQRRDNQIRIGVHRLEIRGQE
ncbi:MAG: hypothetical protein AAGC55_33470, partial [Myxococcota bacterium]